MSSTITPSNSQPAADENVALDGAADPASMDPAAALRPVVLPAGYTFDEDILVLDREPFPLHFGGELPLITSCCPAWVDYMEKRFSDFVPNFSTAKSPQQMLGVLAKT